MDKSNKTYRVLYLVTGAYVSKVVVTSQSLTVGSNFTWYRIGVYWSDKVQPSRHTKYLRMVIVQTKIGLKDKVPTETTGTSQRELENIVVLTMFTF